MVQLCISVAFLCALFKKSITLSDAEYTIVQVSIHKTQAFESLLYQHAGHCLRWGLSLVFISAQRTRQIEEKFGEEKQDEEGEAE